MLGFTALSEAPLSTLPAASDVVTGNLSVTAPVATLSGAASVAIVATATPTTPLATLSADAVVTSGVTANATLTTPIATLSGAAAVAIVATASMTTPIAGITANAAVSDAVVETDSASGGWIDPRVARRLMRHAREYHKAIREERADRDRRQAALFKTIHDTYARITGETLPEDIEEIAAVVAEPESRDGVAAAIAVYAAVSRMDDHEAMAAAFAKLDRALLDARQAADRRAEDAELLRLAMEMDAEDFAMIAQAATLVPILAASAAQMVTTSDEIRLRP